LPSSRSNQSTSNSLVDLPHHDGSEIYVSNSAPKLGEKITLRIRVPKAYTFAKAFIRIYEDGEPRSYELKQEKKSSIESWWKVQVSVVNQKISYRFVFISESKYEWLNARGMSDHDVHSNDDFKIVALPEYPRWIRSSVFYQIFPDRFAKSSIKKEIPDWATPREWDEAPRGRDKTTGTELFGGDLQGVEEHLDHLKKLGINGIYFTPFFPARSNHRYDASSFDEADPLLGGNKALFSLVKAARKEKIAIMGDLTSNHCGAGHPWLAKAKKDKNSKERGYFYWDKSVKHGYVGWWGHASLPKLNFNSQALRREMYEGKSSIVRKWLSPEFGMAGWRIDVGNMTGRLNSDDLHDEVMHGIRKAMDETNPNAWLVAENGDFYASDLDGFGWHGAMNYQGFMRPLWNWINQNSTIGGGFQGLPFAMPRITGVQMVESMKSFTASIPWRSLVASMVLLDSHDTARMRTVVDGDSNRHLSAMALLLTYPGVPSIYAGDEIGLEGAWGEDGRRPMPWGKEKEWDNAFFGDVSQLVRIRKESDALANGGLRWIEVDDDSILFLRESKRQKLLVFISRTGVKKTIDLAPLGLKVERTLFGESAKGKKITISSKNATQGIWLVK
jgi:alpha-glucosidase